MVAQVLNCLRNKSRNTTGPPFLGAPARAAKPGGALCPEAGGVWIGVRARQGRHPDPVRNAAPSYPGPVRISPSRSARPGWGRKELTPPAAGIERFQNSYEASLPSSASATTHSTVPSERHSDQRGHEHRTVTPIPPERPSIAEGPFTGTIHGGVRLGLARMRQPTHLNVVEESTARRAHIAGTRRNHADPLGFQRGLHRIGGAVAGPKCVATHTIGCGVAHLPAFRPELAEMGEGAFRTGHFWSQYGARLASRWMTDTRPPVQEPADDLFRVGSGRWDG